MSNKIELYICDSDDIYLEKLRMYLITKKSMFNVHTFSDVIKLKDAVDATRSRVDILAVSLDTYLDAIDEIPAIVKIILSEGYENNIPEKYLIINKFQKTENLINDILKNFERNSGQFTFDDNVIQSKITGIYSPAGGCGKTALSLLLARAFKTLGLNVFYLNMEHICSIPCEIRNEGSLSNIFFGLRSKGTDLFKLINENIVSDVIQGISMFAPPESYLEWNEINEEQRRSLIMQLYESGKYDVIVIDFDSEFNSEKTELLSLCNYILVPYTDDDHSEKKISAMKHELDLHSASMSSIAGKMKYLRNGTSDNYDTDAIQFRDEYTKLENCMINAAIPDVIMNIARKWSGVQ